MTTEPVHPEREPEIEFLGRIARFGIYAFRVATVVASMGVLGWSASGILEPTDTAAVAHYFAGICIGIPALFPTGWLFGRGRWIALMIGAVLWFGPMLVESDHDFGFVLRMFASFVAVAVLLVWRTVFQLIRSLPVG